MKTMLILVLSLFLLSCGDRKGAMPFYSAGAMPDTVAAPQVQQPAQVNEPTAEKVFDLTELQREDLENHRKRFEEFQKAIQAQSNAMQAEYQVMVHTLIHSKGVKEYKTFEISPDGETIKVIIPKK